MEVKQALDTRSAKVVKDFPMCFKHLETSNVVSRSAVRDPTALLMQESCSPLLFPALPLPPSQDYGPAAILLHSGDYAAEGEANSSLI